MSGPWLRKYRLGDAAASGRFPEATPLSLDGCEKHERRLAPISPISQKPWILTRPQTRATGRWALVPLVNPLQCLVQVGDEVLRVLDAARESNEPVADADSRAAFGRHRGMRHRGREANQALDPTQRFR